MAWVAAPASGNSQKLLAYPNMLLLIDHLGMRGRDPMTVRLKYFPDLFALAQFDNVAVKATAAPSISQEPYPFPDIWPYLHRTIVKRSGWSGWSGVPRHDQAMTKYSYAQARITCATATSCSDSDKEAILGRSLRTLLRWPA